MHAHNWAEDVWENPGRENIYQGSDEILMCQVAAVQEKRMYISHDGFLQHWRFVQLSVHLA